MLRRVGAARTSMSPQSLLFSRSDGWTESKAKAWAKSHGYRSGKVDVTDQYVRIRQSNPKDTKVKRTIPFGRGIRAIVAREEDSKIMARTSTVKSPRRKRRRAAKKKTSSRRRRRVHAVAAPKRRRHRRAKKAAATTRRRRRRTVRVEAKRARRRRSSTVMAPRRRRRRRVTREAWKGNPEGHAKAARKGHRRRRARKATTRRRKRRVHASTVVQAPRRRRRHRRAREASVMESPRRRHRRHRVHASRGGGMGMGEMAMATVSAGAGFLIADALDRFLATYNPSSTDAPPKDKFTSTGAGTLANALNVASMPDWKRLAAGVGITAAPAVGAMFVRNSMVRSSLEGMAVGAGVNLLKTLWSNVLMPMLIGKDTSVPALQKSYIARLYPIESAASINKKASQLAVNSGGSGALSGADVGPFALSGDSPYPTADQVLRHGVSGDSPYPTASDVIRHGVSGDSPYPTASQALRKEAGMGWQPGEASQAGPGPQAQDSCGCVGDPFVGYSSFLGDQPAES